MKIQLQILAAAFYIIFEFLTMILKLSQWLNIVNRIAKYKKDGVIDRRSLQVFAVVSTNQLMIISENDKAKL